MTAEPAAMTAPAAPKLMLGAEELEACLRARGRAAPVSRLDGLDSYLTAVLIGPKFIDPQIWLGQLLGDHALLAAENTREHHAIQPWRTTITACRRRWCSSPPSTGRSCRHTTPESWIRSSGPSASWWPRSWRRAPGRA